MLICLCHGISDKDLQGHITDGCHNLNEVAKKCSAGTGCGQCVCYIKKMVREMSHLTPNKLVKNS